MNASCYETITAWILAVNKSLCLDFMQYIKAQLFGYYL